MQFTKHNHTQKFIKNTTAQLHADSYWPKTGDKQMTPKGGLVVQTSDL